MTWESRLLLSLLEFAFGYVAGAILSGSAAKNLIRRWSTTIARKVPPKLWPLRAIIALGYGLIDLYGPVAGGSTFIRAVLPSIIESYKARLKEYGREKSTLS